MLLRLLISLLLIWLLQILNIDIHNDVNPFKHSIQNIKRCRRKLAFMGVIKKEKEYLVKFMNIYEFITEFHAKIYILAFNLYCAMDFFL